ncbi:MAG: hypothetical protein IPF98_24465 [Gemmatimonadetes bacterium]|nr:hypothetical protein [Gemmatimonadota bacterium]
MYSITRRLPKFATLAVIALTAACSSDRVASPIASQLDPAMNVLAPALPGVVQQQAAVAQPSSAPAATSGKHWSFLSTAPSNAQSYSFTVNPTQTQSFIVGTHLVSFPANTICNPANSSYGVGTWLNTCSKLTTNITITATTWTDANGRAQIDFTNAIRFYPNSSGQLPAVYLRDPSAALANYSRIDYCSAAGSCVDEANADATLKTQRDPVTGYLFRLVRHFSGYNVWA